jgi:hypothetical protein
MRIKILHMSHHLLASNFVRACLLCTAIPIAGPFGATRLMPP